MWEPTKHLKCKCGFVVKRDRAELLVREIKLSEHVETAPRSGSGSCGSVSVLGPIGRCYGEANHLKGAPGTSRRRDAPHASRDTRTELLTTSIPVKRDHRRAKTDRLDCHLMMRAFLGWLRREAGHCRMVAVPTAEQEDARRLTRERKGLVREQTKLINRLKAIE